MDVEEHGLWSDPQSQVDAIAAQVQATAARMREQQQSALSVTGAATSQDGTVRAVVDVTGVVTSLHLAASAFGRTTPDRLARTVVATIQAAARQSRGRLDATWQSMHAPHTERLGGTTVSVPDVPSTATDPTSDTDPWQQPRKPTVQDTYPVPADGADEIDNERPW